MRSVVPKMIGIGEPPLRIEILKSIGVVDFTNAYRRRNVVTIDGVKANVVSMDDLLLMKRAALRDRKKSRDQ